MDLAAGPTTPRSARRSTIATRTWRGSSDGPGGAALLRRRPRRRQRVRESIGIIDVSTLGKILVEGPDAGAFLDRLYPNRFSDLKPGRIRYSVLTTDGGRIMDDGTIGRLGDDLYYVTTTTTGAGRVVAWFEWWNAAGAWTSSCERHGRGRPSTSRPKRAQLDGEGHDIDVSNEAFTYLDAKHATSPVPPCLIPASASSASRLRIH
jgi:sarcosine oxidase subunit alpha